MAGKDFTILQGKTFSAPIRWEAPPIVYKEIASMSQTAPFVLTTVVPHELPDGWRCAIVGAKGMTELNAEANAVKDKDYHVATVTGPSAIQFNDVNASGFKPYASGGHLQYNTPIDLAGFTARMQVRDKIGGTILVELTTATNEIILNNTAKTILLVLSAEETAAFTWVKGVYDLELVSPAGVVTQLLSGKISVSKEVTS